MKTHIRAYKETDYDRVYSWWEARNEVPPCLGMMIEDGTFILELDGEPVMTLTALTTQSKHISFFEGYCAKPGMDKTLRNMLGSLIWGHGVKYLQSKGYTRVNIVTDKLKLLKRYEELGMELQMTGLYSLGKEI